MGVRRWVPLLAVLLAGTAPAQQLQVSNAHGVAIGDVTGDGRPDVVATTGFLAAQHAANHRLFVFPQTSAGTLGAPWSIPLPQDGLAGVVLGDLDRDGTDDIVVGVRGIMVVRHAKGRLHARTFPGPEWASGLALTDADGDGILDVVATGRDSIYYGDGHGWIDRTRYLGNIADFAWQLRTADLDQDGHQDLVAFGNGAVSFFLHDGIDAFLPTPVPVQPGYAVEGMTIADFNDDGLDDIVTSDGSGTVSVLAQQPQGGLAAPVHLPSHAGPRTLASADLDDDGKDDVVVAHGSHNTLDYFLNGASNASLETQDLPTSAGHHGLAVADIDSDGCPDYVLAVPQLGLYRHRHDCAQPPDMGVRAIATPTAATVRVQHLAGAQPITLVHASIRLAVRAGPLQLGTLPGGCALVGQASASASLSCLMDSLAPGATVDTVIPLSVPAAQSGNELQMRVEISSDTRERTLTNNVGYSRIRIEGAPAGLAPPRPAGVR